MDCPLCCDPFSHDCSEEEPRTPIVGTRCGHSYCRSCITSLHKTAEEKSSRKISSIPCPMCRKKESFRIDRLVVNFGMCDLISIVRKSTNRSHILELKLNSLSVELRDRGIDINKFQEKRRKLIARKMLLELLEGKDLRMVLFENRYYRDEDQCTLAEFLSSDTRKATDSGPSVSAPENGFPGDPHMAKEEPSAVDPKEMKPSPVAPPAYLKKPQPNHRLLQSLNNVLDYEENGDMATQNLPARSSSNDSVMKRRLRSTSLDGSGAIKISYESRDQNDVGNTEEAKQSPNALPDDRKNAPPGHHRLSRSLNNVVGYEEGENEARQNLTVRSSSESVTRQRLRSTSLDGPGAIKLNSGYRESAVGRSEVASTNRLSRSLNDVMGYEEGESEARHTRSSHSSSESVTRRPLSFNGVIESSNEYKQHAVGARPIRPILSPVRDGRSHEQVESDGSRLFSGMLGLEPQQRPVLPLSPLPPGTQANAGLTEVVSSPTKKHRLTRILPAAVIEASPKKTCASDRDFARRPPARSTSGDVALLRSKKAALSRSFGSLMEYEKSPVRRLPQRSSSYELSSQQKPRATSRVITGSDETDRSAAQSSARSPHPIESRFLGVSQSQGVHSQVTPQRSSESPSVQSEERSTPSVGQASSDSPSRRQRANSPKMSPRKKSEVTLLYLDDIKREFKNRPDIYTSMVEIIKDCEKGNADSQNAIRRVTLLLRGHPNLILGFNAFLPDGQTFSMQDLKKMQKEQESENKALLSSPSKAYRHLARFRKVGGSSVLGKVLNSPQKAYQAVFGGHRSNHRLSSRKQFMSMDDNSSCFASIPSEDRRGLPASSSMGGQNIECHQVHADRIHLAMQCFDDESHNSNTQNHLNRVPAAPFVEFAPPHQGIASVNSAVSDVSSDTGQGDSYLQHSSSQIDDRWDSGNPFPNEAPSPGTQRKAVIGLEKTSLQGMPRQFGDKVLLDREAQNGMKKLGGEKMKLLPDNLDHPRYAQIGDRLAVAYGDSWQPFAPQYAGQLYASICCIFDDAHIAEQEGPFSVFMKRRNLGWEYCGEYQKAPPEDDTVVYTQAHTLRPKEKMRMVDQLKVWTCELNFWRRKLTVEILADDSPPSPQWMVEGRQPEQQELFTQAASLASRARALGFYPDIPDDGLASVMVGLEEFYRRVPIEFVEYREDIYEFVKDGETTRNAKGKKRAEGEPAALASDWYNKHDREMRNRPLAISSENAIAA